MTAIEQLAKSLHQSQIVAASKFWLEGSWDSEEFEQLKKAFPSPLEAISIKAMAVNVLYGTNILAISKVADCLRRVLERTHSSGPDLGCVHTMFWVSVNLFLPMELTEAQYERIKDALPVQRGT